MIESRPLDVLVQLLERPQETIEKEELLGAIWRNTTEQSLPTAISKLRRAFGGAREAIILTISGIGYRMAVPVNCKIEADTPAFSFQLEENMPIPGRKEWMARRQLGESELGPVWMAVHESEPEAHVFKFALDGVRLRALQREVMISRLLKAELAGNAPWFTEILRWNFEEQPFYIETRFCGLNLTEWAATKRFLEMPLASRILIGAKIADAVASAHALGVLHNDLKPTNILIEDDSKNDSPDGPQIHIMDFGIGSLSDISRLQDMQITDYGVVEEMDGTTRSSAAGTVMYRAPELSSGSPPTVLADIYALGMLVYQIVIGDFTQQLSPGWEVRVPNRLLQQDIVAAAQIDPALRLTTATELAHRLHTIDQRQVELAKIEDERAHNARIREAMARAKVRRPWIALAACLLLAGACVSWVLYRRAVQERNLANKRSDTMAAMYDFLAHDLLGQTNPYMSAPRSHLEPETLREALRTALPKIDERFRREPEIAGKLHETIADSFKSQSQYIQADQEFRIAAQRFQDAEGPNSQHAVITELKRENTELSSRLPGALEDAQNSFRHQQAIIAEIRKPMPELLAWQALIFASIVGFSNHPQNAIPQLTAAIHEAEAAGGVEPALLIAMKARICGLYVRLQDGPNLERSVRSLKAEISSQYGAESPLLTLLDMYLQEALYLEGKYRDAISQADRNFAHFSSILGPQHELTLATLANRAASEGQLGLYDDAVRDDLRLYKAERSNPSGKRMEEGALADAALYECHAGHYQAGISHASQVIRETSAGPQAQPMYAHGAMFTLAECYIGKAESEPSSSKSSSVSQAESFAQQLDPKSTDLMSGGVDYEMLRNMILARLSLLKRQTAHAKMYADEAAPSISQSGADPYERAAFAKVMAEVGGAPHR